MTTKTFQILAITCKSSDDLLFWSCPNCHRKMVQRVTANPTIRLFCTDCQDYHELSANYRRFKLPLKVADCETRQVCTLTVFGKSVESVIGCEADTFAKMLSNTIISIKCLEVLREIITGCIMSVREINRIEPKDSLYPKIKSDGMLILNKDPLDSVKYRLLKYEDIHSTSFQEKTRFLKQTGNNHFISDSLLRPLCMSEEVNNENSSSNYENARQEVHKSDLNGSITWEESLLKEFNDTMNLDDVMDNTRGNHSTETSKPRKRDINYLDKSLSSASPARERLRFRSPIFARKLDSFFPPNTPSKSSTPVRQNQISRSKIVPINSSDDIKFNKCSALAKSEMCKDELAISLAGSAGGANSNFFEVAKINNNPNFSIDLFTESDEESK